MNAQIIATIITIIGGVIVASLTYFFTKKKEKEIEWRKEKMRMYMIFVNSLSKITDGEWNEENAKTFCNDFNNLYLFASNNVITALQKFGDETATSNKQKTHEGYLNSLTNLINEIRIDLEQDSLNKEIRVLLKTSKNKH